MVDETLTEIDESKIVCHINSRTKPLFRSMLNQLGNNIKVGKGLYKYGDTLYKLDKKYFDSLFNIWVSKCLEKKLMKKTLSSNSSKKLEWSSELSEVERAFKGMEVLKEML